MKKTRAFRVVVLLLVLGVGLGVGIMLAYWFSQPSTVNVLGNGRVSFDPASPPYPDPDGPQPKCVVDEPEYDFGLMEAGAKQSHTFVLRNEGDYPLKLVLGRTTCKCTLSELDRDEVPPGESAEVVLDWTAKPNKGAGQTRFRQEAEILTNDRHADPVRLAVTGKLRTSVIAMPNALSFSNVHTGEERKMTTRLYSTLDPDFKVEGIRFEPASLEAFFKVKLEPVPVPALTYMRAKAGYELELTLLPDLPPGNTEQKLVLETNCEGVPPVEVLVLVSVAPEISVLGNGYRDLRVHGTTLEGLLKLGTIKSQTGIERALKLMVRGEDHRDVQFSVEKVSAEVLDVSIGEPVDINEKVRQFPLTVAVRPGSAPCNYLGTGGGGPAATIELSTTHPRIGKIVISVRFLVGGD